MQSEAQEIKSVPSKESSARQYRVRFLTNGSWENDPDVKEFLHVFNEGNFTGEISEQKITNRSQNQKGQIVRALNPCADLYAARRWQSSLLQQPNSVMLVKIERIRDEPLLIPLIMEELFKKNRSVLISGANTTIQRQLQASIDLEFKTTPPMIEVDQKLVASLLERAKRSTGFQNSMRTIGILSFLSEEIREKINLIQTGKPVPLEDAEIINLCLLADLCSRYEVAIQSFTREYQEGEMPMPTLSAMFDTLTMGIKSSQLIEQFLPFVNEEDQANVKNKALLCGYIYQNLTVCDKSAKKELKELRPKFNQLLRETVLRQRIQMDMIMYRRSFFLIEQSDVQQIVIYTIAPIYALLHEFLKSGEAEIPLAIRMELCKFFIQIAKKGKETEAAPASKKLKSRPRIANTTFSQVLAKHKKTFDEQTPEQIEMEQMVARKIFAQMHLQHFDLFSLWDPKSDNSRLLEQPKELLRQLLSIAMGRSEIFDIVKRFKDLLFPYNKIVATTQKRVIDIIEGKERGKIKELEQVYILHSLAEVVHYYFDLGDKAIHSVERTCASIVLNTRLGLDTSLKPRENFDITLFQDSEFPKLGVLQNDPLLVAKSYVALLGKRVSERVKRLTDHKINHLMKTYRKNFFEMLYESVVVQDDIPLSRIQLVKFLRSHNILANLMDKGWEESNQHENMDPMLPHDIMDGKETIVLPQEFKNFEEIYQEHFQSFVKLLQEIKESAEAFPKEDNPNFMLWSLFQKGIYNLSSHQAKQVFRKSLYYKLLQNFISYNASKHYKHFTGEIIAKGVHLYIPRKYRELLFIGTHFSFLVEEKLVRYTLLPSLASLKELDQLSQIFRNEFDEEIQKDTPRQDIETMFKLVQMIRRWNRVWTEFSRSLTLACVDRILTETSVKMVAPGKILPQHLKFSVADKKKLYLGKAMLSGQTTDFSKFMYEGEEMASVLHFKDTNLTTLEEFAIAAHKIEQMREEFSHYSGLSQDVLNILRTLTCDKAEAPFVAKMESALELMVQLLSKPLRSVNEQDIQTVHKIAKNLKALREKLHAIRLESKDKRFITRLREELHSRRSDNHQAKIEFSDAFILQTTEVKILEKTEDGEKKQQKREMEVETNYQTLSDRIREVIKIRELLEKKQYMIFAPEGQRKKHVDYLMNSVRNVMSLRGKSIQFYLDTTTLDAIQQQEIAKLIKPTHFYKQMDLTIEMAPVD